MNLPAIANATIYGAGVLMVIFACIKIALWKGDDEDVGEIADFILLGVVGILLQAISTPI
jgi:hypothetical protein